VVFIMQFESVLRQQIIWYRDKTTHGFVRFWMSHLKSWYGTNLTHDLFFILKLQLQNKYININIIKTQFNNVILHACKPLLSVVGSFFLTSSLVARTHTQFNCGEMECLKFEHRLLHIKCNIPTNWAKLAGIRSWFFNRVDLLLKLESNHYYSHNVKYRASQLYSECRPYHGHFSLEEHLWLCKRTSPLYL